MCGFGGGWEEEAEGVWVGTWEWVGVGLEVEGRRRVRGWEAGYGVVSGTHECGSVDLMMTGCGWWMGWMPSGLGTYW